MALFHALSPAVNCGYPGTPTRGRSYYSSTYYNAVVSYSCDVAYRLLGSRSRTCQANGQWSGNLPQCNCKLSLFLPHIKVYTNNHHHPIIGSTTVLPDSSVTQYHFCTFYTSPCVRILCIYTTAHPCIFHQCHADNMVVPSMYM